MAKLPETHILGSIDLTHFAIELGTSEPALLDSLNGGSDNRPAQVFSHELTHWGDIVGTIWGQNYIDKLFLAMDTAIPEDPNEHKHHHMISFFDLQRKTLFPQYYKWLSPNAREASVEEPWRFEVSCGGFFDFEGNPNPADPIMFAVFRDHYTNEKLIRQPITISSILEMRAVASEIMTFMEYATSLSAEEHVVSEILLQRRISTELYHHELTTYTAAAHYLASVTRINNAAEVYMLGYGLTEIILNLQPQHLTEFVHPIQYAPFTQERLDGFIAKTDLGYLFCALALSFGQSTGDTILERTETALGLLGLPNLKQITESFTDFWGSPTSILRSISSQDLLELRLTLAMSGAGVAHIRNLTPNVPLSASQLIANDVHLPVIMTGEGNVVKFNEFGMSEGDHDILYRLTHRLDFHTKNSLRAARGYDFNWGDYTY